MEAELEELNCLDVDLDTPILRMMASEFVLKDHQERRLTQTRIGRAQWFDPTESWLLVAQYEAGQGKDLPISPAAVIATCSRSGGWLNHEGQANAVATSTLYAGTSLAPVLSIARMHTNEAAI